MKKITMKSTILSLTVCLFLFGTLFFGFQSCNKNGQSKAPILANNQNVQLLYDNTLSLGLLHNKALDNLVSSIGKDQNTVTTSIANTVSAAIGRNIPNPAPLWKLATTKQASIESAALAATWISNSCKS